MTAPYDHEALWVKAKLFLNRAMDEEPNGTFDESAFWASAALELLAKAALARVSPLLIAEPTEDGLNLLIAIGLVEGDARFTSVKASTLWKRCHKAFKPFSEPEARLISAGRNEYLHGSGAGFDRIPAKAWWPRYWAQAAILVSALDRELSELVGHSREAIVENHLAQNARNIENRIEMLIERARQRVSQRKSGFLSARIEKELNDPRSIALGLAHSQSEKCPACGALGTLEGEETVDTRYEGELVSDEDYELTVTLTIGSDCFSCDVCRLLLDGYELVVAAKLPDTFEVEGDESDVDFEPEYGND